ncbi:hypothetical protein Y032_0390g544 [Ancylostoma ceylanicum]|uniref:Uncharacterized protein n=1 Tax=Ancylostoma ceylanicum TaxID=53326 RepID=A0A016RT57_9BILA|nr:hypothetical protein Y032_0390g544 [Ancylostoma ceylanicum]
MGDCRRGKSVKPTIVLEECSTLRRRCWPLRGRCASIMGGASLRPPSPAAAAANIGGRRRRCWRRAIANFGDRRSLLSLATVRPMRIYCGRLLPLSATATQGAILVEEYSG